jgi:1,4-dihydroxy-2-naphthoate polyprenyltransferase
VIQDWIRVIRLKFLLASVIAAVNGIAVSLWKYHLFDFNYTILTLAGVLFLHASIDLLNDYWDYKRGIDKVTKRTKFSGGTGVLPDNILSPRSVYIAALIFLALGIIIGTYFVVIRGIVIGIILSFAIFAVYFYSSSIVNVGLGEVFVAIKGALIVVGAFYVQTSLIDSSVIYIGTIVGLLSASVLLINSFPDYIADLSRGRRTLVIILGKKRTSKIFSFLIIATYAMIIYGMFIGFTKMYSLSCLVSLPFALEAIRNLKNNYDVADKLVPAMAATVNYARITGLVLAISLIIP